MANKILCGGFQIDGTSLVEENGILKATAEGLPDASKAKNGQGLIVDKGEFKIGDLPEGLPEVTVEDAGSTLYVDAEGKWAIKPLEQQQVEGN